MARRQHSADVVVIGARAAGAATAMLLARAGLSVIVVERDRAGADTLSTHALMRGGVVQLKRWGLLDHVVAAGTPAIVETAFHYLHQTVQVSIKPAAGVAALYAPRRVVLDPILARAAAHAGAELRYRTSLIGVVRERGRVVGVRTVDREGREELLTSRLVVGADGRRSLLARLVGAPTTHRARHTSAFTYGYFHRLPAVGYEWAYGVGTAGFIPTNDGLTCVFAGDRPERVGRGGSGTLPALVTSASPGLGERLGRASQASPVRTFTGLTGYLRRPWGPGWALVGDAGSWKDPISAHGLTDALRDAELLTRAAVVALGGDGPDEWAYRQYEVTRDRLSLPILRGSDEVAAMAWDEERIGVLLRELNTAMNAELDTIAGFDEAAGAGRHALAHTGG